MNTKIFISIVIMAVLSTAWYHREDIKDSIDQKEKVLKQLDHLLIIE